MTDLVKAQPKLFLGCEPSLLEAQISGSYGQLNELLPPSVDIDAVVQDQPSVLFQSSSTLGSALQHLKLLQLDHIEPADTARLLQVGVWHDVLGCVGGVCVFERAELESAQCYSRSKASWEASELASLLQAARSAAPYASLPPMQNCLV